MTRRPQAGSAARALLGRYRDIVAAAWAMRKELAGPSRLADEAAFLPAALAVRDTPMHPAPRRTAFVLMGVAAIALTAYAGKRDRERALESGFDHHLTKPIETVPLFRAIESLLRQGRGGGASRAPRAIDSR